MEKIKIQKLTTSILIPFAAGFIGSLATSPAIPGWYANLNKPSFNPPNWIFGPVWTTLYVLMGISLYLIRTSSKKNKKLALYFFYAQIAANSLWSIVFFGLQNPLAALLLISTLWVLILINIISFYKLNKLAGLLLVPYILWVSFAAFLNYFIWMLN